MKVNRGTYVETAVRFYKNKEFKTSKRYEKFKLAIRYIWDYSGNIEYYNLELGYSLNLTY